MKTLTHIFIENFKSIKRLEDLELRKINILIGENGAGKSNFISFFDFLMNISQQNLQNYIIQNGGADNILHYGVKESSHISGAFKYGDNAYYLTLFPIAKEDSLFIKEELIQYKPSGKPKNEIIQSNSKETKLHMLAKEWKKVRGYAGISKYIISSFNSWRTYHFQDTSDNAGIRKYCNINDNIFLRKDGSNLAAFLYWLKIKYPQLLNKIESLIRLIAPYFDKFILEPNRLNEKTIFLEWKEKGNDKYFNASHLSDGTLRMMCLITLLNQPNLPPIIIIDEPELGLHPAAINYLASMINKASKKSQFIITTQSVNFINYFEPEDIVVVDRKDNQSVFNRLSTDELKDWLEEYSIGEIWEKNVIGGRP